MVFKFRHKVLLALAALALLSLSVLLGITLWRLQTTAEARVRQGLADAVDAFYLARGKQAEAVTDAIDSLASTNPELRSVLASRSASDDPFASAGGGEDDLQILESSLPFLPLYQRSAQFLVLDVSGKTLLAKDRASVPASPPASVQEALAGKAAYDWWPAAEGGWLQVFAAPVKVSSRVVGAVLVGYPIDRSFLGPLESISKTRIETVSAADGEGGDAPKLLSEGKERYLSRLAPVTAPSGRAVGRFRVSRSLTKEMREATELRDQLALVGLLTLAAAAAIALYLASLVSRPLEALGRAVQAVKAGDFAFRLGSQARDEFGTLSRLIDEMAAGLEERERIRATFGRYVDDEVVETLLKSPDSAALDGEEKQLSVLFADLANFTAFSEGKGPKQVLAELNEYFAAMARAIDESRGILDKFIGDAVMAYWGAPVANSEHAAHACRAALECRSRFETGFSQRFRGLGLRVGIATGTVLVGNVGSERRQNYTVMGDTVNLASRLEGVNKAFGTCICVSDATRLAAGASFRFRTLGRVRVAGRSEPERVHELLAEGALAPELEERVRKYEHALAFFERGEFASAEAVLAPLAQSGDAPTRTLIARCGEMLKRGSSMAEWDGVWQLTK